jgi:oligopeptide/dipeptide ABC transporter ATP-binding protein
MYAGKIVESGPTAGIFAAADAGAGPAHPYTARLRHAFPDIRRERTFVEAINGQPPDLHRPPVGCRFADRCDLVIDECRTTEPELAIVGLGHQAACHRSDLVLQGAT